MAKRRLTASTRMWTSFGTGQLGAAAKQDVVIGAEEVRIADFGNGANEWLDLLLSSGH